MLSLKDRSYINVGVHSYINVGVHRYSQRHLRYEQLNALVYTTSPHAASAYKTREEERAYDTPHSSRIMCKRPGKQERNTRRKILYQTEYYVQINLILLLLTRRAPQNKACYTVTTYTETHELATRTHVYTHSRSSSGSLSKQAAASLTSTPVSMVHKWNALAMGKQRVQWYGRCMRYTAAWSGIQPENPPTRIAEWVAGGTKCSTAGWNHSKMHNSGCTNSVLWSSNLEIINCSSKR